VVKNNELNSQSEFPTKTITPETYSDYLAKARVSTSTLSGTFFIGSIHTVTKGYICEDFAQEWLVGHGIPAEKKGAMLKKTAWDISIGRFRYDVKTNVVRVNPCPSYRMMVREDQLGNEQVTHFIGAYFKDPEMRLFLNGWISKSKFMEKAERHHVGDVIDRGTTITHDCRTVRISEMGRMEDIPW